MTRPLKLLLIADSDSQLLACEALCSAPTELNVQWSISVIPRDGTPRALLQRLAQRASLRHQGLTQLLRYDAVPVGCCGIVLHPKWQRKAYPVTFFTVAPYQLLADVLGSVG